MMRVEEFSKRLFTTLAPELIAEIDPVVSKKNESTKKEKLTYSKSNDDVLEKNKSTKKKLIYSKSNYDVSRSVLMLSYAYGPAFRERFIEVFPILIRKISNLMIYVRCFAEVLHKRYSPLKFLVLCSFVSEIVRFLSDHGLLKTKRRYVQKTTGALNHAFHRVFERDFPENGWRDIKKEASVIASGFKFLEPLMNKEALDRKPISHFANGILTDSSKFKHKCRQTNAMTTIRYMQQMANTNVSHNKSYVPGAKALVNISKIGVPIQSDENFATNENAHFLKNQFHIATFCFGTIDEDGEISRLVRSSVFIFEYPPSGMDPHSPKIDETANSKIESKEHLPAMNSEEEIEAYFRVIKKIENLVYETCTENNGVVSEQELIDKEEQFWEIFFAIDSEEESEPSIKVNTKVKNSGTESCIGTNKNFSGQQPIKAHVQFWKDKLISTSRTEMAEDIIEECFSCLDENGDHSCEAFSKEENANDSKSEAFSKEENANDSKSEAFAKENTLVTGNAINISDNQPETFHQRQSNAPLQLFIANEKVPSQDAQQANKIDTNFRTNEKDLSTKVLHLNLGGKNIVLQMPANFTLIFEYKGSIFSSWQPEK